MTRQRPFQAARRGLARTFQIVQPFPNMTVLENVTAGALFGGAHASRHDATVAAREQLEFAGLTAFADRPASALTLASGTSAAVLIALLAVVSGAIGVLIERWLFFAEAEHVSMLYYGRERA